MILVTGGNGYLGRALVARLVAQGESVRVLSHQRKGMAGVNWPGDITQPATLDRAMEGVSLVYHLAALVDHHATTDELHRVNVQGTINLVEAALRHGVRRLVHCSSVSAEPGGGSTVYGRSKIEAEQRLRAYQSRMHIVTLRPGPIYDHERRNLQRLVRCVRTTRICPRPIPDVTVHLASRANVVDAFALAQHCGSAGQAYAICDRYPITSSALVALIQQHIGALAMPLPLSVVQPLLHAVAFGAQTLHAAFGVRPWLDRHYIKVLTRERHYDINPAIHDLGYHPAHTEQHFTDAVRRCLDPSAQ